MNRPKHTLPLISFACLLAGALPLLPDETGKKSYLGEQPAIRKHLDQSQIEKGTISFEEILRHGQHLFEARFNRLDGQGRAQSTGDGRKRNPGQPRFIRTSGPEANSCAGCHIQPAVGGAGDFVANVFVAAQTLDPVTFSVAPEFGNERNTMPLMGTGPIEMLAREMSADLIAIREKAIRDATESDRPVTRDLASKGVSFGKITVLPDGRIDPSQIEGVDWDLIIKPFHQKGAAVSLREFTNNAMNHHHGMQSEERFGEGRDPDQDQVVNELTVGDITAITIFQAALGTPGRKITRDPEKSKIIQKGEKLFSTIGCSACHLPSLTLENPHFTEPNPYNPVGNLRPEATRKILSFDMTREGRGPRLERTEDGKAVVRAFTDLKRHNLNDAEMDFFANETLAQGSLLGYANPRDFIFKPGPRPTEEFLTRRLWDVGSTMPYGHRGDLTMITEAIYFHGGEGRASRTAFLKLAEEDRGAVLEFLKSLQILSSP